MEVMIGMGGNWGVEMTVEMTVGMTVVMTVQVVVSMTSVSDRLTGIAGFVSVKSFRSSELVYFWLFL